MLVSSEDVLHLSSALLGLKTDAIPGRLNQATLISNDLVYIMDSAQKSVAQTIVSYQLSLN